MKAVKKNPFLQSVFRTETRPKTIRGPAVRRGPVTVSHIDNRRLISSSPGKGCRTFAPLNCTHKTYKQLPRGSGGILNTYTYCTRSFRFSPLGTFRDSAPCIFYGFFSFGPAPVVTENRFTSLAYGRNTRLARGSQSIFGNEEMYAPYIRISFYGETVVVADFIRKNTRRAYTRSIGRRGVFRSTANFFSSLGLPRVLCTTVTKTKIKIHNVSKRM